MPCCTTLRGVIRVIGIIRRIRYIRVVHHSVSDREGIRSSSDGDGACDRGSKEGTKQG